MVGANPTEAIIFKISKFSKSSIVMKIPTRRFGNLCCKYEKHPESEISLIRNLNQSSQSNSNFDINTSNDISKISYNSFIDNTYYQDLYLTAKSWKTTLGEFLKFKGAKFEEKFEETTQKLFDCSLKMDSTFTRLFNFEGRILPHFSDSMATTIRIWYENSLGGMDHLFVFDFSINMLILSIYLIDGVNVTVIDHSFSESNGFPYFHKEVIKMCHEDDYRKFIKNLFFTEEPSKIISNRLVTFSAKIKENIFNFYPRKHSSAPIDDFQLFNFISK